MDTEVERLVVRMVGDMSHYLAEIEKAKNATQSVAKATEAAGATIEKFGKPKGGTSAFADYFRGAKEGVDSVATSVEKANAKVQEAAGSVKGWGAAVKDLALSAVGVATGIGLYEAVTKGIDKVKAKIAEQKEEFDATNFFDEEFSANVPTAIWGVMADAASDAWDTVRSVIGTFVGWFQGAGDKIKDIIKGVWSADDVDEFGIDIKVMADGAAKDAVEMWDRVRVASANALTLLDLGANNIGSVFKKAWDEAQKGASTLSETIAKLAAESYNWASEFVSANRDVIGSIGVTVAAILGAVGAWKLLGVTIAAVDALLTFLGVKQLATLALWGAWKVAVLAAAAVTGAFSLAVSAAATMIGLATAATGAWAAAKVILAGAVTAVNAALTITNVLLLGAGIVGAAVMVGTITAAFAVLAAATYSAWEAVKAVATAFASLETASGPIGHVSGLLKEWNDILLDTVVLAQKDMPAAWDYLKAAATLAIEQIKQLWPPLWVLIQKGAQSSADLMRGVFVGTMKQTLAEMGGQIITFGGMLGPIGTRLGFVTAAATGLVDKLGELNASGGKDISDATGKAQKDLQKALDGFDVGEENEAVKEARRKLEEARVKDFMSIWNKPPGKPDTTVPDGITTAWKKAENAVRAYDAALYGSADAMRRLQEYTDHLADSEVKRTHEAAVAKAQTDYDKAHSGVLAARETGDRDKVIAAQKILEKMAFILRDARAGIIVEETTKKTVEEVKKESKTVENKTVEETKKKVDEAKKEAPPAAEEIDESLYSLLKPEKHYGGGVLAAPGASKASGEVANFTKTLRDAESAALALDRAMIEAFRVRAVGSRSSDLASITAAVVEEALASKKLDEARKAKVEADAASSGAYAKLPSPIDGAKKAAETIPAIGTPRPTGELDAARKRLWASVPGTPENDEARAAFQKAKDALNAPEVLKMPSVEEVPPEALKTPSVEKPKVEYETDWTDEPEKAKRSIPILDDRNSLVKWQERQDARKAELAAMPDDERDMWDFVGRQSDEVTKATVPIRDDRNALVKFAEREAARKAAESDTFAFADEQARQEEEDRRHQEEVDRAGGVYGYTPEPVESKTDKLEELLTQIREAIYQNKPLPPIELQEVEIS